MAFFQYGEAEVAYLRGRDERLAEAIHQIGMIQRPVEPDLFRELVRSIVAQQISSKALATIWGRMLGALGDMTPQTVAAYTVEAIQAFGISFRKARHIQSAAQKIHTGAFDLSAIARMDDEAAYKALSALDGVGVWTAEMLLIFSLERRDVLSYGDLGIRKGLCVLHGHEKITKPLFETYRRLYSPFGTVASLYLWAIAGGALGTAPSTSA